MSLVVIKPLILFDSSTNGNFSILFLRRISLASSKLIPGLAVITSVVISSLTSCVDSDSNITSLLVRIPASIESESLTKSPETSFSFI